MKREELGREYRDIVTGFVGVCTAITTHITGCDQFHLQPKAKKDGTIPDGAFFDVNRVERVGRTTVAMREDATEEKGADPRVLRARGRR